MSKVLTAENVSKKFQVQRNRPRSIREAIHQRLTGRYDTGFTLWALRDVSFSLERGRVLGIIGHNGAGKSTLLRLLCELGRPSSGHIRKAVNIGGLLELGNGFHHDLTGRENLLTGGILCGLTKREVKEIEDEIISFAELEEFIDQPVRTYSSGMYMRLAFATAINFNPELLIIDEILSVGDSRFQKKCADRLKDFRESGKSMILVSHDTDQIKSVCNEVLVLEDGQVAMLGDPESAISYYHELMWQRTERRKTQISGVSHTGLAVEQGTRQGTLEASIESVCLYDDRDRVIDTISSGDSLTVELQYRLTHSVSDIAVLLGIYSETGVKCLEISLSSVKEEYGKLSEQGSLVCRLPHIPLLPGKYYINIGFYPTNWDVTYDYHWEMHSFHIFAEKNTSMNISGFLSVSPTWSVMTKSQEPASLVTQEIRYHMPKAGEVFLIWGINTWTVLPEEMRPTGTVVENNSMHTPMNLEGDTFIATVQVPLGVRIDYGFDIRKKCDGSAIRPIWDGDYHITPFKDNVIEVKAPLTLDHLLAHAGKEI